MSNLGSKLFNFADKLLNFAQNFEKIPNKYPEIAVLIIFPILVAFFGYFHEPWFDEAQAWQIAKVASYRDILFYIPHFEGHPPFWHLLLSIFAKSHFPYEITIKSISFVFSYAGVILILFKSPFYRIIKVLLPFTYFLFYHNALFSRPYCLVMPAFAILAIYFYKKQDKPFHYAFGLVLLTMAQPYSLIISAFLTLIWFIETLKEKRLNKKTLCIFTFLGILYILTVCLIFPSPEAYAVNLEPPNGIFKNLIYTFFVIPADCFISYVCNFLALETYDFSELIFSSFIGCIIWFFIYYFTKKDKLLFLTFLIPYIPFAVCATKYFSTQHLVIPYCFIIFICWITIACRKTADNNGTVKKCFILFVFLCLITSLYWNFKSCILDIFIPYTKGKKEAEFIKKHNLDKYKIFVEFEENKNGANPNLNGTWLAIAPYFEKNIFYNFNDGLKEKNYVLHKKMPDNEIKRLYSLWSKGEKPDVIAGFANTDAIFKGADFKNDDYIIVYSNNTSYIHKGITLDDIVVVISVKKDLAKKLNLERIEPQTKYYKTDFRKIIGYYFAKFLIWKDEQSEKAK